MELIRSAEFPFLLLSVFWLEDRFATTVLNLLNNNPVTNKKHLNKNKLPFTNYLYQLKLNQTNSKSAVLFHSAQATEDSKLIPSIYEHLIQIIFIYNCLLTYRRQNKWTLVQTSLKSFVASGKRVSITVTSLTPYHMLANENMSNNYNPLIKYKPEYRPPMCFEKCLFWKFKIGNWPPKM